METSVNAGFHSCCTYSVLFKGYTSLFRQRWLQGTLGVPLVVSDNIKRNFWTCWCSCQQDNNKKKSWQLLFMMSLTPLVVWKLQTWYSYPWSLTRVSTGNYNHRTNKRNSWLFLDSPELGAILSTFLGVFAGGSLFICFTNRNHTHQKTIVKQTCKQQKPSTTTTTTPKKYKTNSTLSKAICRQVIVSKIKNVSCTTHDNIWLNASIVRWEDFTHVQTNWKWEI